MLATGLTVFVAAMLLLLKLPRRWKLRMLHYDLWIDWSVSLVVLIIHFGTFSGVMAATVAGLLTSIFTSAMKKVFGSLSSKGYEPGLIHLTF